MIYTIFQKTRLIKWHYIAHLTELVFIMILEISMGPNKTKSPCIASRFLLLKIRDGPL